MLLSQRVILLFAIASLITSPLRVAADSINLPDMGDSSAQLISAEQERRIGRQMMRQIKHSGKLVEDPLLTGYINDIGKKILAGSEQRADSFTFFIVDDPSINAFAMPGGYIGIHTGLLLASRNEGELASVLAHEIAHVTQHHLARGYEKASQMNLPLTAAVIAAILLGGSNPQAANAALASSTAAASQMQLNYSRDYEQEADRVGMQYLAGSGYDPHNMPSFFQRLYEETRLYGGNAPEFLLTHPVTESRIADSLGRASQYPTAPMRDESHFMLLKAKLTVLTTRDKQALLAHYGAKQEAQQDTGSYITRFSQAIALFQVGRREKALHQLQGLVKEQPERIILIDTYAQALLNAEKLQVAIDLLNRGLSHYPYNTVLSLRLAEVLLAADKTEQARSLLTRFILKHPDSATGHRLLAKAETRLGNEGAAHLAMSRHYYLTYETDESLKQLELAKKSGQLNFYDAAKVDARMEQLKGEMELERRN